MNRKCGPKKSNRAIKFFTARLNGVLRGGVGSRNRRRPLKPLEEHFGMFIQNDKHAAPHFISLFFTQCI